MTTVNGLISDAAVRLGDSSNTIWSAAELLRYANTAQNELCRLTKCLWKQRYLNDQEGEGEAELPTDCLAVDRATWNSLPLDMFTTGNLQGKDKRYRTLEGRVLALGLDVGKVYKFRVPSISITSTQPDAHAPVTDAVENTRIEYFATPAALVAGAQIDLPSSYTKYIRHYVLWQAYQRNGPGQNEKLAKHYEARWLVGIARIQAVRSRLVDARTRYIGGGGKRRQSIARPVYPPEYGRIVRG